MNLNLTTKEATGQNAPVGAALVAQAMNSGEVSLRYKAMQSIKDWIVKSQLKCMLIDYQLSSKYQYTGTQLAFYLDDELPGLPYLILTSYPEDSINEKLVVENAICDRSIMDRNQEEFFEFCEQLKQMTEVFDNTIQKYKEKYKSLIEKKQITNLSVKEEEELVSVFRILRAYKEVDEIPAEMLKSSVSRQIDVLLGKLDNLLKE